MKILDISDHACKARNACWIRENLSSGLTISEPGAAIGDHLHTYFHTPTVNTPRNILFEHAETALCIRLKQPELFNALKDLERIYDNLIEVENLYRQNHSEILVHLSRKPALTINGRRKEAMSDDLDPRMYFNLCDGRSFIMQLSLQCAKDADRCRVMATGLLAEKFDLRMGMKMIDDLPGVIRPIGT